MKTLIVLHPLEKYGPDTGGAISIIARNLVKMRPSIGILALDHHFTKYESDNQFCVRPLRMASWLLRFVSGVGQLPYRGQAALVLAAFWHIVVHKFESVIFFNDAKSALVMARWCPSVIVSVWYQNEPDEPDVIAKLSKLSNVRMFACSDYIARNVATLCDESPIAIPVTVRSAATHHEVATEPTGRLTLVYVGRLDPNKGVDFCVDVMQELVNRRVDCLLTIVGGLWFYPDPTIPGSSYVELLQERAIGLPIKFTGHISHDALKDIYMKSDIQLVPSKVPEPAGLVAIEGLVNGCYVLSSNLGGLPEYVDGFGKVMCGFDARQWADVICHELSVNDLRSSRDTRIGNARREYSWEKTCQILEKHICHR